MITFNDFIKKYNLKKRATSTIRIYQILCSIGLNNVGIYLRDGSFESNIGFVNLHTYKRTHWVCYINENYFNSNGCAPLKKLSRIIIKRNGYCIYSEYQIQKHDSICAICCLYILYLTKELGIDFKSAVLNLYYQRFSLN